MTVAVTQPISMPGSEKLISGYPHVGEAVEEYLDDFDRLLSEAVSAAQSWAVADIRSAARADEGWKQIADYLEVEFDGEGFSYIVDGHQDILDIANELEYGNIENGQPPTGFLRKTALAQAPKIGKLIESQLMGVPSA